MPFGTALMDLLTKQPSSWAPKFRLRFLSSTLNPEEHTFRPHTHIVWGSLAGIFKEVLGPVLAVHLLLLPGDARHAPRGRATGGLDQKTPRLEVRRWCSAKKCNLRRWDLKRAARRRCAFARGGHCEPWFGIPVQGVRGREGERERFAHCEWFAHSPVGFHGTTVPSLNSCIL